MEERNTHHLHNLKPVGNNKCFRIPHGAVFSQRVSIMFLFNQDMFTYVTYLQRNHSHPEKQLECENGILNKWVAHQLKVPFDKAHLVFGRLSFLCCLNNRVFHDKEIWPISVRLSDRSEVIQRKINFVKNCPQWGLNPQPPDHQSPALPNELGRNLLEISEVSFLLFHAPLHMLGLWFFLESIEHDFIKALMIHH